MMTNGDKISEVRNSLKLVGADYRVPNRFIWAIINKHMRWLIKRDDRKMRLQKKDFLFQTLKCVEVENAPSVDDCCGVRSKCTVFRTKVKIPKLYEGEDGVIIKSIYSLDGSIEFQPISLQQYIRKLDNPNSKYDKTLYYYYNNGYVYFPQSTIRKVMIKGYFEDDIQIYNDCEAEEIDPCHTKLDDIFRFPDGLGGELMQYVIKDMLPTKQIRDDGAIDKQEKNI